MPVTLIQFLRRAKMNVSELEFVANLLEFRA
jgi:hypothetical protein